MATPSPFQIECIFERLWESWPNKQGENSSLKAFQVAIRSGENHELILKAAEIYLIDHSGTDPEYIYKLGNFIREEHWKDYLQSGDKLLKLKQEAEELIKAWNAATKKHWNYVHHPDSRMGAAIKALHDPAFRQDWRVALKKAEEIFRYPKRENDPQSKITLSFGWFTKLGEKHTVLRLMEGGYGEPEKELYKPKPKENLPIDQKARSEAANELLEMFPQLREKKERKERVINPQSTAVHITPEAQAIADQVKSQLGKRPYATKQKTPIESLAEGILKALPPMAEEKPEDPSGDFSLHPIDNS